MPELITRPYSGAGDSSLPSNVKKLPKEEKKAWVETFNSVYSSCVADGGSQESCEEKSFKIANAGIKDQLKEVQMPTDKNLLRRMWDRVVQNLQSNISVETERVERAIGIRRLWDQLWEALGNAETSANGWAYPLDIYFGDDGSSVFTIVAQNGKLFQIPLSVSQEALTLGDWVQVTEVFQPVGQSSFTVKRQKDGTHRWLSIAATTVLNRVAEMDSAELFDSFIVHAERTGKYPRLDFYHLGETDPKLWEFGTADYLARDGVCYIASGTFDEGHPLAKAFIQVAKEGSDEWGNSIEFYAYTEPEIIVLNPKIQVPVYKEGENTRISVVLEKDAACLFTRMIGFSEEKKQLMDPRVTEALKKLLGDDEEALKQFTESADLVNQTVKNEKLIHRRKDDPALDPPVEDDEEDEEDTESDEDADETEDGKDKKQPAAQTLELDDTAVAAVTEQLVAGGAFKQIIQSIQNLTEAVTALATAREKDEQELTRLKKANSQLIKKVDALSVEETRKKQTYLEDMPKRKATVVTYRKRDEVETEEDDNDLESIAQKTLATLPSY